MKSAFSVYQWVNEQNTVTNSMSQWAEHWDHEHCTGTLTMHCHSASTYEQVSISHWHHNRCAHHNGTVPVASTVTSTALMTRDSGMWLIEFVTLKHSAYDKRLWDVTSTVTLSCETLGQWRETMKTCHELNESSSYFNVTNSMRHWDNEERLWSVRTCQQFREQHVNNMWTHVNNFVNNMWTSSWTSASEYERDWLQRRDWRHICLWRCVRGLWRRVQWQ